MKQKDDGYGGGCGIIVLCVLVLLGACKAIEMSNDLLDSVVRMVMG